MKHATPATLALLSDLLQQLRELPGLVERKPGTFYRKSAAFLHFHEDPEGLFADVKLGGVNFTRMNVSSKAGQTSLLRAVKSGLPSAASRKPR